MAATAAVAGPSPYDGLSKAHRKKSPLTVDLGYSVYSGVKDTTFGVNSWKGYVHYLLRYNCVLPVLTGRHLQNSLCSSPNRITSLATS